jgi:hypothetical protein
MTGFSDDDGLNREHHNFLSITVAVYLGGAVLLIVSLGLIMRYECGYNTFTALGWLEFLAWIGAFLYSGRCANRGQGVFRLLNRWEQSLLRRRRDLEDLAACRAGKTLYRVGIDGIARQLEERDGVLVAKASDAKKTHNR